MKNILLMGLDRSRGRCRRIMIGMNWRDHRCITLKREPSLAIPSNTPPPAAAEACVLDPRCSAWACASIRPANATPDGR